jgi:hypothetical protein
MLTSLSRLHGSAVQGFDGEVGSVARFLLQVNPWVVRYIVVSTGTWSEGGEVLISPWSIAPGTVISDRVALSLNRDQVRQSPRYDAEEALTREHERALLAHYGYPMYWVGPMLWGPVPAAAGMPPPEPAGPTPTSDDDRHLGTTMVDSPVAGLADSRQVVGTHLQARDGDIGHVHDFLVESESWRVRYLVIDTKNWWTGRQVLIAPEWIDSFEWPDHKVHVSVDRAAIENAPEYDPDRTLSREDEVALYRHYRRGPYWAE